MEEKIYKIFTEVEWNVFQETGRFKGSPDDVRDGFIHLSTRGQIDAVIERFFADKGTLYVAEFSSSNFYGNLKWEKSASGEAYPHLYGTELFLKNVTAHVRADYQIDQKTFAPVEF